MELVEFIFQSVWHFAGTLIIIEVIGVLLIGIIDELKRKQ